ncbi:MAG: polysaccharide deacetylase family protein [Clostridia bacterium]|nr:polysaccharide deacetylase family protein [Clostridia bacterium]
MKKITTICLVAILCLSMPICLAAEGQAATSKLVAITFDDGPSGYTPALLDGLKARGAKATFFVVGNRVNSYSSTMYRIVNEGHQLGNHTTTHPNLNTLSLAGVRSELNTCESRLAAYGGNQTYCIRPPYGNHNANVRSAANGALILWSVDTLDWQSCNADAVYNKIISNTTDGSIVLLHDLYPTSVQGALRAIDTLKARGYEFVTVNELFRRRGITLQKGGTYSAAYNQGFTLPAIGTPETPTATVTNVKGGKKVTLSCDTEDTVIYYTTDGTAPTEKSKKYSGSIKLTAAAEIRAVAYNGLWSDVLIKKIEVASTPAPEIQFENGVLTLTAAKGVTLYGTQDGSKPTTSSPKYTAAVTPDPTYRVLARSSGKSDRYITYTVTKHGKLYTDVVDTAWYYKAVGEAEARGIMRGTEEYAFSPEASVSRAMFVTALYRMSPDANNDFADTDFTDCEQNKWYSDAVNWATQIGIVKGMGDGRFAPNDGMSRQEMCCMLNRYLKYYRISLTKVNREAFADASEIAIWAVKDVTALYEMKLINGVGDGCFAPKLVASRAECAKILVELDTKI